MQRKSGFHLMKRLILVLKPLSGWMLLTIGLGVLGFLAVIGIGTLGAAAVTDWLGQGIGISFGAAVIMMGLFALARGPLRYAEQLCGHYIAFRILAILRDQVFVVLRSLAPAKLESKEKGNLVALITADIELLEVFYAHTVAPISIAVITNTVIALFLFRYHPVLGIVAALFYGTIGFGIPYFFSKIGKQAGVSYREEFGRTNSYLLDSLRGLREVLMYKDGRQRASSIHKASERLNEKQSRMKFHEGAVRAATDLIVMGSILTFIVVGSQLAADGRISFGEMVISIVLLASSFGPVVALGSLSNSLLQTLASAQRVFDLLDEEPEVSEIPGEWELEQLDIQYENVSFAYQGREEVLRDIHLEIKQGESIAVVGESGTGKSTFVKLLMRFWDCDKGQIDIGGRCIRTLPTKTLRKNQVSMGQDTYLFQGTIEENIRMEDFDASKEEVIAAAQKAAIHSFIMSLPQQYETKVEELGTNFSSGERQRIGLARAFLKKADIFILDEPTSNLDTLNEGQILKAIKENTEGKTMILITHRKSTASICRRVLRTGDKKIRPMG